MRDAEALYWKDKFENANSSGDFWRVVREMQGKAKPSVGAIRNENENIIINAKDKAESFNQFFSTAGEKLADVIIPDNSFNIFHHIYQVSPTIEPLKINSHKIKRAFDKKKSLVRGLVQIIYLLEVSNLVVMLWLLVSPMLWKRV